MHWITGRRKACLMLPRAELSLHRRRRREAAATPAKKAAQTVISMVKKPESPATPEPKSAQTPSEKNRKEFREITHVTELYLGKTLTKTEVEELVYFYDVLGMSADLIEYLIEYCVENGHKSIHYIKKVALSAGIAPACDDCKGS